MILTDREIAIAIQTKQLIIDPEPDQRAYSSTSIDLSLASDANKWKAGLASDSIITPGQAGFSYHRATERAFEKVRIESGGLVLEPGQMLLAWTKEFVKIPRTSRLAARIEGKSSLARLGIGVHLTAPTIHSGFEGQIQLEMVNHGPLRVQLMPGMRVCQLILEVTLGVPDSGYHGIFIGQRA